MVKSTSVPSVPSMFLLAEMMVESTSVRVSVSPELATPLPSPPGAVFLVMVECSMTLRPKSFKMPPPLPVVELPLMVELVMVVFGPERPVME